MASSNTTKIDAFVHDLSKTKATPNAVNPWDYSKKSNEIRRDNLNIYLSGLLKKKPSVLLVGEAPGYRGMCKTGVPFSSEKMILTHPFFTQQAGFLVEKTATPLSEASATIVWKTLDELNFYPLIWASFPFHPHKAGNKLSNRAPTKEELILGQTFLLSLIDIFNIQTVIAVGRIAEKTLADMNIPIATQVRHPSHGGAVLFKEGLRDFLKKK